MIGSIAGDLIASPYRHNPLPDSGSIFFPLFSSSTKVEIEGGRSARSRTFSCAPTPVGRLSVAAARWMLESDHSASAWRTEAETLPGGRTPSGPELLAVCAPVSELSEGFDSAFSALSTILSASGAGEDVAEGAEALLRVMDAVKDGLPPEGLRSILREAGYDPDRNPSEMRPFLAGTVIQTAPGKLGIGDGKPCREPAQVIPAALAALLASESYEEAVRRAVAMAGDPCLTASLTGAMAARKYGVPETIASAALDYLPPQERMLIERFERLSKKSEAEESVARRRQVEGEGKRFSVIRMDGRQSIYVIPEGASDIEAAIRKVARKTKMPYETVRPDEADATLARLSIQADASGAVLDGTYAEHARPEVKHLWLQDGSIRTSTTRKGVAASGRNLPSPERRMDSFNVFKQLREYAEQVRSELERVSCAEPPEGRHVHFASAFYPVVLERRIDLMQGDILRGRVCIDDDGRIRVDTSAPTGGVHTEGLEGVLATMDIFHKNDGPAEIKASLDRWCLDRGAIEDEEERRILAEGGEDAEGVRMRYRSNIDTAVEDLCSMSGDMAVAVIPDISPRMKVADAAREAGVDRSREKYAGVTREQAVWSKSHPGSIFTIGHSNLPVEDFEGLLKKYGIQLVVDVRSFPKSRYSPQYDASVLGKRLEDGLGIGYQQAGDVFGGHLFEGSGESRRRLSFAETAARPDFLRYMKALRECAREGTRVALLGTESDPASSHRFALLGYSLAHPSDGRVKPIDVQHITRAGLLVSQNYLEDRLVKELGLSGTPDALPEAIRMKGEAIVSRNRDNMPISLKRNMRDRKKEKTEMKRKR